MFDITTKSESLPNGDVKMTFSAHFDDNYLADLKADLNRQSYRDLYEYRPAPPNPDRIVVFKDGTFVICTARQAHEHASINPDYVTAIDVPVMDFALREHRQFRKAN